MCWDKGLSLQYKDIWRQKFIEQEKTAKEWANLNSDTKCKEEEQKSEPKNWTQASLQTVCQSEFMLPVIFKDFK